MTNINFTDIDKNVIRKLMGRNPEEAELDFLKDIHGSILGERPYFETLRRLNHGAKRNSDKNVPVKLDENNELLIVSTIRIAKDKRPVLDLPSWMLAAENFNKAISVRNQSGKKFPKVKGSKFVNEYFFNDDGLATEVIFSAGIKEVSQSIRDNTFNDLIGHIYYVRCNHPGASLECLNSLNKLYESNWLMSVDLLNGNTFANTIHKLTRKFNSGIKLEKLIPSDSFSEIPALIICIKPGFDPDFKKIFNKKSWKVKLIGNLKKGNDVEIAVDSRRQINLPLDIMNYINHLPEGHHSSIDENIKRPVIGSILPKIKNYNSYALKLFKFVVNNIEPVAKKKTIGQIGISSNTFGNYHIGFSIPYNQAWCQQNPRSGGRIAVATAIRNLVCHGFEPVSVSIQNVLPAADTTDKWKGIELIQGQEEVIRFFDLPISNRNHRTHSDQLSQNILVTGKLNVPKIKTCDFKDDGDFITILGSHRGELGGSAFIEMEDLGSDDHSLPALDLAMDQRIQNVLQLGIAEKLLSSTINIGCGGLTTAVFKSIINTDPGFGARIFFSRKLIAEELLFGETQGVVMVTLKEKDIMEFERICIKIGVPSTTIGRVTGDGNVIINDLIKIKTSQIQKELK